MTGIRAEGFFLDIFKISSLLLEKEKKIANIVCEALGFKRKQKRRVFRLCYNNLILIPRQLFKITIVVHVNGLKSFKKIVKLKIKKLE